MKTKPAKQHLCLLLLLAWMPCAAQTKPANQGKKNIVRTEAPAKKFPFGKCDTILLISFSVPEIIEPSITYPGKAADSVVQSLARERSAYPDTLGHKDVREIVVLSKNGIGQLSHVLNKITCKGPWKKRACYDPRNAVLFIGRKGEVIAELEVCFECLGYRTQPSGLHLNDTRECFFDALKKVFADAGVKYGIVPDAP